MKNLFLALVAVASLALLTGEAQAFGGRRNVTVVNGVGGANVTNVRFGAFGNVRQVQSINGGFVPVQGVQSFQSFQSFSGGCGFGSRVLFVP